MSSLSGCMLTKVLPLLTETHFDDLKGGLHSLHYLNILAADFKARPKHPFCHWETTLTECKEHPQQVPESS